MPKIISTSQSIAYLRALADTGNATLAAEQAGVSRDWAYKRRLADERFDALCCNAAAIAKARLPARVNRERAGGWTAERERRFVAALAETRDVRIAAGSAGLTGPCAYRHRRRWPAFAAAWHGSMTGRDPMLSLAWYEAARCFFTGEEVPPENPLRITSVEQVLRLFLRARRG